MQAATVADPLADKVSAGLTNFTRWLDAFGETSLDHQTFFAGPIGGFAKSLYYQHPKIGIAAVAPIIFCEAFIPSARRLFHPPFRFPIADAHYRYGICVSLSGDLGLSLLTKGGAFSEPAGGHAMP